MCPLKVFKFLLSCVKIEYILSWMAIANCHIIHRLLAVLGNRGLPISDPKLKFSVIMSTYRVLLMKVLKKKSIQNSVFEFSPCLSSKNVHIIAVEIFSLKY